MSDAEFHRFMDGVGHMAQPEEFRLSVYRGGVEPALRKVVWRHLLGIYPEHLSGRERFDYLQRKVRQYHKLRDEWRSLVVKEKESEEIRTVITMVKKDVLRTDRTHKYYAGSDDSKNVVSLFSLLVTYAVTHPDALYCQGMSDIASPILLVQDDEANAYICFCSLMRRLKGNFMLDGKAMTAKFQHLSLLLQHQDPDFFAYLKEHNADDMFFCYRWLLLEMKREFPLDEALYMLEVMWSSLPPDTPQNDLALADLQYQTAGLLSSPASPTLASQAYLILLRSRLRRNAKPRTNSQTQNKTESNQTTSKQNGPSKSAADDIITPCDDKPIDPREFEHVEDDGMTNIMRDKAALIEKALHEEGKGECSGYEKVENAEQTNSDTQQDKNLKQNHKTGSDNQSLAENKSSADSDKHKATLSDKASNISNVTSSDETPNKLPTTSAEASSSSASTDTCKSSPHVSMAKSLPRGPGFAVKIETTEDRSENASCPCLGSPGSAPEGSPKRPTEIPLSGKTILDMELDKASEGKLVVAGGGGDATADLSSCEEAMESLSIEYIHMTKNLPRLPSPAEFGYGNPFLMFLCLTLLVQHRDHIMAHRMDYNDLAMHFDKMVRRHNVIKVVHHARTLYTNYLKSQQSVENTDTSSSEDVSV